MLSVAIVGHGAALLSPLCKLRALCRYAVQRIL